MKVIPEERHPGITTGTVIRMGTECLTTSGSAWKYRHRWHGGRNRERTGGHETLVQSKAEEVGKGEEKREGVRDGKQGGRVSGTENGRNTINHTERLMVINND